MDLKPFLREITAQTSHGMLTRFDVMCEMPGGVLEQYGIDVKDGANIPAALAHLISRIEADGGRLVPFSEAA